MAKEKHDPKKFLQSDHKDERHFSYKKGDCNLSFKLRTDIKQELKDFKEILEQALKDVSDELATK